MDARHSAAPDIDRLLALVRGDELDAAIESGLMACDPAAIANARDRALLAAAQEKLRGAWAARERHRAREARLARRAAERLARGAPASGAPASSPPLPPAAAAALARAKAKALRKP
ncbi:hypothetical protein [Luteimonas vadosa]|uniref:Uncharacterized protein n=1 Tax=Luteimonas vadosa TaxID=1165507 RepID=A0ABP9DZ55_9GAMM